MGLHFLIALFFIFMLFARPEQQIGTPVTDKVPLIGKWESRSLNTRGERNYLSNKANAYCLDKRDA